MKALEGFKGGAEIDILIATDVAGRGIDVKGVTHVVRICLGRTPHALSVRTRLTTSSLALLRARIRCRLQINYEMPQKIEAYAHRIGRTGRAGMDGKATSFVTPSDTEILYDLKEFLQANKQVVPAELARHEAAQVKPGSVEGQKKKTTMFVGPQGK